MAKVDLMKMNKNTKLLLIAGGALVAMPLIKGVLSLIKFGGNVLEIPMNVWHFIFDEGTNDFPPRWTGAVEVLFKKVVAIFSKVTYNKNDPRQVETWNAIKNSKVLTDAEKHTLLGIWIMPKPDGIQRWAIEAKDVKNKNTALLVTLGVGLIAYKTIK